MPYTLHHRTSSYSLADENHMSRYNKHVGMDDDSRHSSVSGARNDERVMHTTDRSRLRSMDISSSNDAMDINLETDLSFAEIVNSLTKAINVDMPPTGTTQNSTIYSPEVSRTGSLPAISSNTYRMRQDSIVPMIDSSASAHMSTKNLARNHSGSPTVDRTASDLFPISSMSSSNLYRQSSHSSISATGLSSGALTTGSSDLMTNLSTMGYNSYHQNMPTYNPPLYMGSTDSLFEAQASRTRPLPSLSTRSQQILPTHPERPHAASLRQIRTQPSQQQPPSSSIQRPVSLHYRPTIHEEDVGGVWGQNETHLRRHYQSEDDFSNEHRYRAHTKPLDDDLDLMIRYTTEKYLEASPEEQKGPNINLHGSKLGAGHVPATMEAVRMDRWGSVNSGEGRRENSDTTRAMRRRPCQLDRPYVCPCEGCPYRYEWWRSLQHHLARKHNLRKKKSDYPQFVDLPTR